MSRKQTDLELLRHFAGVLVSRAAWHKILKPHVSGISMDVVLFSDNGSSLVHHYQVFGRGVRHMRHCV